MGIGIGDSSNADQRNKDFLALLGQYELKLAACVHSLVPSWHDAEDILQETRLRLWREFETFRPGSDFLAWSRTIARYVVLTRMNEGRRKPILLSHNVQDLVMENLCKTPRQTDHHLEMLAECVEQLSKDALDLLQRCYVDGQKIKDVAIGMGRTLSGTYTALSRIRRILFDCVRERLRKEGDR